MRNGRPRSLAGMSCLGAIVIARMCLAADDLALPEGVKAVWDSARAWRQATPTRERMCVNGLWRWQPADGQPG